MDAHTNSQWQYIAMMAVSHSWVPNVLQIQTTPFISLYTENQPTSIATWIGTLTI